MAEGSQRARGGGVELDVLMALQKNWEMRSLDLHSPKGGFSHTQLAC